MRHLLGSSVLLIAGSLAAQSPLQTPSQANPQTNPLRASQAASVIVVQPPAGQNCPVGLSARHAGTGAVERVSPGSEAPGQRYSITFSPTSASPRAIAQARVTLHGISGHHILPAGQKDISDETESAIVLAAPEPNHRFKSVVSVRKLTGVQWIELNEITFADGSTWHASTDSTCRVTPNGYMLVTANK